jgi:exodeoxyribonuclease VII large subunit
VQGDGALEQLCTGLRFFSSRPWAQVVILARGGGSLEDLWTFNEEALARAIASSAVPVISAVGHETDFTIADFVADLRAPTPSVAAELVVPTRESLFEQIDNCRSKTLQALRYRLVVSARDLHARGSERAATSIRRALARRTQYLDELDLRLDRLLHRFLDARARRLADLTRRLQATDLRLRFARDRARQQALERCLAQATQNGLFQLRRRLDSAQAHLTQLSPLAVLARGYAIVEDQRSHILRSAGETAIGEELTIRLHEGKLVASVVSAAPSHE